MYICKINTDNIDDYCFVLIAIGFNVETVTYKNLKFQGTVSSNGYMLRYELTMTLYLIGMLAITSTIMQANG